MPLSRVVAVDLRRVAHRRIGWVVGAVLLLCVVIAVAGGAASGDELDVDTRAPQILSSLAPYTVWIAAVLGASAVGAELATGGVSRLLCREPRRGRVLVAEVTSAAALACAVYLATTIVLVTSLVVASAVGPFALAAPLEVLGDVAVRLGWGAVAAGLAGALGACAALLAGSTGAAVVGLTVVAAVVEPVVGAAWSPAAGRGPVHVLIGLLNGGLPSTLPIADLGEAAALAVLWAGVVGVGTWLVFARSDRRDPI